MRFKTYTEPWCTKDEVGKTMARFPSLPEQPHLADVFMRFSKGVWPLMAFHDEILPTRPVSTPAISATDHTA